MIDLIINSPFSILISGPSGTPLSDTTVYLGSAASGLTPTVTQLGSSNVWNVTFTPVITGVYSVYAFGQIQTRLQCLEKSIGLYLKNIEDESLGSWSWNKTTGVMTMLRQNGSALATFNVVDNTTVSSRELT